MKARNVSMIKYFNCLANEIKPKYAFSGSNKADFKKWKSALLAELKRLLGPMPQSVALI